MDVPPSYALPVTDPRDPLPVSSTEPTVRLPHLRALTSIRFFAALHVAFFHLVQPVTRWGRLAPVVGAGYTAVSFFFLLSGFILTYSHSQEAARVGKAPLNFWVARFARIYPVYLLSLLFGFYVHPDQMHHISHAFAVVLHLLMLQSWVVHILYLFNVPAWSLSVEAFFYFLFPFLLLRLQPRTRIRCVGMIAAMWLLAMAAPAVCIWLDPVAAIHGSWQTRLHPLIFNASRLPVLALPVFCAGISLGWFHLYFRPSRAAALTLSIAGAAGLLVAFALSDHMPVIMLSNGLLLPLSAMLLLGLAQDHAFSRLLSGNVLVLLGEASFSLYLFHFLIGEFTRYRFHISPSRWGGLFQVLISIALALALHLGVERPSRKWILRQWRTRAGYGALRPAA